ncbi:hypothetical protein DLAC_05142 [Tieghemostelium lacteum]|uniref:Methyltransferase domain-containing protein n=1 Tax=Tieghemostelium lacteum TaxID=361077 RepID=A0A151ZID8_TIELA|nr:hypothetical protein DLAC_05142 [Tieghemostelium lacteum]|eukprot:KYQ93752.1 hypothetical protein DLAC_05142 [Tieghemostelium lacteum]
MEVINNQESNISELIPVAVDNCAASTLEKKWQNIDNQESPNKFIQYVDEASKQDQIIAHTRYSTRQLMLEPGFKVMDVGCGAGKDLSRLESLVESHGEVYGIDISREMVECARARMSHLPNVEVFCGDASQLPVDSNTMDAIRCERLLQHVPSPDMVIAEMVRVTKNGGRIVITDVDWSSTTISIPKSIEKINRIILNDVVFNAHPTIGIQLKGRMKQNKSIDNIEIFAQCLYTDSLAQADELLWLGERGKMAVQQGLISEEDYNQWRETIEQLELDGNFVFTMNIFTVSGTINKK